MQQAKVIQNTDVVNYLLSRAASECGESISTLTMTMTMTSSLGTILVVGYGDEPFVQIRCLSWSGISVYGMRMAISGVRMRFFSSIPRNGCCGPGCLQGRTFRGLPLWTVGLTTVTKEDGRATESQLVVRPDQAHCRASPCWDARCEIRTFSLTPS